MLYGKGIIDTLWIQEPCLENRVKFHYFSFGSIYFQAWRFFFLISLFFIEYVRIWMKSMQGQQQNPGLQV